MRIGLYINCFNAGGAERVVSRLSFILSKNNHSVFFIVSDGSSLSYPFSGTIIDFQIPATYGINKLLTVNKRIRKLRKAKLNFDLDIVISFLDGANLVNSFSKIRSCKNMVSIRNYQQEEYKQNKFVVFKNFVLKKIYKKADFVIACSRLIAEETSRQFFINMKKVGILYNPYDCKSISDESKKIDLLEYKEFCSLHDINFVTTGRLSYQKGFWHLVKVISGLQNEGMNVGCLIIGQGEHHNHLTKLIKDLNMTKHIKLCGYQQNPFAIEKYADAYIMTSLFEGFPNAMVEAMCLGLPIIAADCKSGPREILAPSKSLYDELDSVYQEFGILMPKLSPNIDWSITFDEQELYWIETIKTITPKIFKKYSIKSSQRSLVFSEEAIYQQLEKYVSLNR